MEFEKNNCVYIKFPAIPENEKLSRMMAAAFLAEMNPTVEELDDVKTAVSEAVTNCIIHAYNRKERNQKEVELLFRREEQQLWITVTDWGKGIENVSQAMEPMFTTRPKEERSGMGFSFMEAFMDEVTVESVIGEGTSVQMKKSIGNRKV